jgi:vitamin B12 transporter
VDLGVELQSGRNRFSVTLFSNTYEDLVDFDFDLFTHVNRSRIEAEGVEILGHWQATSTLRVASEWTWQDVDDVIFPIPVLHAPEWFGNLRLEWSPIDPLRLHLEGRFVDGSEDVEIPVPDQTRVEGYEVVDLAASWRVTPQWMLRGRVENLGDTDYQHFIGFPQPGRAASLGLQYDFR